MQIGHHHRDQQSRDVRVRFANEHELNDNHPKGIALYHRGFKLNGYTQHSGTYILNFQEKKNLTASASSGFHNLLPFHEVRTIDNRGTEVAKFGTEEPPGGIIWY